MTRERWLLVAILAVGFLLRLTYLLEVARAPDFDLPQFEAQYHDYWARALVTGDWTPPAGVTDPEIPERPYFRPPGYPFFLAMVYQLTGPSYFWPRLVQMVIGLLSCLLLYSLTRRGFGRAAGLFASGIMAVYWVFIFFEAEFMAVGLLIFLLLASLVLAARWATGSSGSAGLTVPRAVGVGVLVGLAILVRPNAAVLMSALALWAGWLAWRRDERRGVFQSNFFLPALAFVATAMLVTSSATIRNFLRAGDLVWVTSNAGINLFVGTHPESDGIRPGVRELGEISGLETGWDSFDYPLVAAGVERLLNRPVADSEVSAYFTRRAWSFVVSQPADVAELTLRKLALFWGPAEISNNKVIELEREASPALQLSPGFTTVLALALAGVGLMFWEWRAGVRRPEIGVLLLLFILLYSASFLPFFVAARFRAPVVPILMVFAGHALAGLWRELHGRRYRQLAAGVALVVVLRALTGITWVPYEPDRALWHWRQGLLWKAQDQAGAALEEFERAVEANPGHDEARLSLAEALAASGRSKEAIEAYRATLKLDPPTATAITAHNNLARLLAGAGDFDAAIEHWRAVLEIDPDRLSALNNLAYALATHPDSERRDPDRAVIFAERACELTRRQDPRPLIALSAAYRAAGRILEAETVTEEAQALASQVSPREVPLVPSPLAGEG